MANNKVEIIISANGKTAKKEFNTVADAAKALEKQAGKAEKGFKGLGTQTGKTSAEMGRFVSKGKTTTQTMNELAGSAGLMAVAYSAAKITTQIVKTGAAFEKQMATVKGVTGATSQEFAALTGIAKEMGSTTEWSASQSAEALQYLGMAGFSAGQSVAALPGVLDLATAGNLDLGRASDIVTDSLTAMGLGVSDLSHFNDVLVGTITQSNTNIEQMGEAFKYAAPIAHSMGYEVEQVSALLGTMANAGIKASDAGTDLRQAMLRNGKAAAELGTENDDLIGTIRAAKDAQWDANKVQEEWGMIASKSVLVLMENIDKYEELYGSLQHVEGATSQLAGTMRDTVSGAFKSVESATESVQIKIYDRYKDMIKDGANFSADYIRNVNNAIDGMDLFLTDVFANVEVLMVDTEQLWDEAGVYLTSSISMVWGGIGRVFTEGVTTIEQEVADFALWILDAFDFEIPSWMPGADEINESLSIFRTAAEDMKVEAQGIYEEARKAEGEELAQRNDDLKAIEEKYSQERQVIENARAASYSDILDSEVSLTVGAESKKTKVAAKAQKTVEKLQKKATATALKEETSRLKYSNDIYGKGLQRKGKLLTDWEKDQIDAQEDLVKEFEELTGDQYEFERDTIRAKAQLYEDAGADQVEVAEWAADEIEQINKDELEDYKQKERKKTLESDNFFAGVAQGWDDLEDHQQTWAETGATMIQDFADSASESLSSNLFDAIHGDMDSLSGAWDSLWDAMLQTLTDKVAEMVVVAATNQVVDMGGALLGSFGMSGLSDSAMDMLGDVSDWAVDLLTFHSGAYELQPDEFTGKLQQGEMIIPKAQSDQIRESMDAHGYGGDFFQDLADTVNMSVDPTTAGYQALTATALQNDFVNSLGLAGLAGAKSAIGTYGMATQYGMPSDRAAGYAMDAFASQGFTSLVSGFMSSALETGFGLGTSQLDFGIGTVDTMTIAKRAINVAMALGAIGIPGSLALAASPVLGLGLDAAFDAMDVRSNESFLDSLEENAGSYAKGLRDRSMLESYSEVYGVSMDDIMEDAMRAPTMEAFHAAVKNTVESVHAHVNEIADAKKADLVSAAYGQYGKAYADAVFAGQVPGVSPHDMAVSIGTDRWGFASYDSRIQALETLGLSTEDAVAAAHGYGGYGGNGLSSDGLGTQGSAYAGADSADIGAAIAQGAAAHAAAAHAAEAAAGNGGGYGYGDGPGGTTSNHDSGGIGGTSGGGSPSSTGHTGRWTGGDVTTGHQYRINEFGNELFMPGYDGRILSADQTQDMLDSLRWIADNQESQYGKIPAGLLSGGSTTDGGDGGDVAVLLSRIEDALGAIREAQDVADFAQTRHLQDLVNTITEWDVVGVPQRA